MQKTKKTQPSTICRVNKNQNYTVMSNYHLRSKNLSLKAKGLLCIVFSLPDDWDYSIAGLVAICKESVSAVKSALAELKEWGYLTVTKLTPEQTESGRIEYVYDFFEYSKLDDEDTIEDEINNEYVESAVTESNDNHVEIAASDSDTNNSEVNASKSNDITLKNTAVIKNELNLEITGNHDTSQKSGSKIQPVENRPVEKMNRFCAKSGSKIQPVDFLPLEIQPLENRTQLNTNKLNTNNIYNQSIYPSINQSNNTKSKMDGMDRIDVTQDLDSSVKVKIDYRSLIEKGCFTEKELNEIVELIVNTLKSTKESMRLNGEDIPIIRIKEKFSELDFEKMKYISESLSRAEKPIRNMRKYILTTLYNASLADISHDTSPKKKNSSYNQFNDFEQREFSKEEAEKLEYRLINKNYAKGSFADLKASLGMKKT
jgi:hypothetical protein